MSRDDNSGGLSDGNSAVWMESGGGEYAASRLILRLLDDERRSDPSLIKLLVLAVEAADVMLMTPRSISSNPVTNILAALLVLLLLSLGVLSLLRLNRTIFSPFRRGEFMAL